MAERPTRPSFYVTTPIYYANGKPHIGHAYTTLLADVLARYHRLMRAPTFFLTGTDEHGEKVVLAAAENDRTPLEQCDVTVQGFQNLWTRLDITYDDFIRTTEPRHKQVVQKVLQDLYERGEIYRGKYEGWYCVPDERFFTEKDLVEGQCPLCNREVKRIVEPNYFFRMSAYQEWLIEYIESHPEFIQPDFRRNETLGFLRQPLTDLCVSRPKSRLAWGIELPFDTDYVCYVWFDALLNYISAIGYGVDESRFETWWPPAYQLIGKDILTTHTVYWPTMLRAIGVPMPRTVFAHGWWLVGRDKMGKSLGNVVDPMTMSERYGGDAFRYYLLAEMSLGQDASFTEQAFIDRYNLDLADGLGNMLNRVVKLARPNFQATLPGPGPLEPIDLALQEEALAAVSAVTQAIEAMKPDRGMATLMTVVRSCNRYFEQTRPWTLAKEGRKERLGTVLYTAAEALRVVSGLLWPVMPAKMAELRGALGVAADALEPHVDSLASWGGLEPGTTLPAIMSLFPRIQDHPAAPAPPPPQAAPKPKPVEAPQGVRLAEYEDFAKLSLRIARVRLAERLPKADRLLRLEVEVGDESRQIVAGIAEYYRPEDLPGKLIVIIANLRPRKIRGMLSNGMLLAAGDGERLRLLTVDGDMASGVSVS